MKNNKHLPKIYFNYKSSSVYEFFFEKLIFAMIFFFYLIHLFINIYLHFRLLSNN